MKTKHRFPSLASLRAALVSEQKGLRRLCSKEDLSDPSDDSTPGTDCRLQVRGSSWYLHTGSSDYDQDHRGVWGASFLPYGRTNLTELARDLIDQARDGAAEEENAVEWRAKEKEDASLRAAGLHPLQTGYGHPRSPRGSAAGKHGSWL